MYRLTSKLIIYRNIEKDSILFELADICRRFYEGNYDKEQLITDIFAQIHRLLEVSTRYGFDKNLWHNYLAYLLASTENPFTLVSEKVGANEGTVNQFAKNDFAIFKKLFDYDFSAMEKELGIDCFNTVQNYEAVVKKERIFNKSVSEKVQLLSKRIEEASDEAEMYDIVTDFYKTYGVGKLGLNKAFRISEKEGDSILEAITTTGDMLLSDLVGYEAQKKLLIDNTEAFVAGGKANNVLLFGDAGTGKSTSVKAILNEYYDKGLRMIEIYKHEFKNLSRVISEIKNRNYRFIIFMDDLSFEEFEIEYKYLKAVIEGGLEVKPDNVLIYATSNRQHLIRETWTDRSDISKDELHRSDTVQEKLSLSGRFGLTIGFLKPTPKEYYNIVITLARKYPEIALTDDELRAEANKWEMRHGGLSGRTAQQFINHLLGMTYLG
ncbi:MAG: ATP-binding protein [Firmicutes bacterium]|nr:ATP-binding protein [Bacillota bacterium]